MRCLTAIFALAIFAGAAAHGAGAQQPETPKTTVAPSTTAAPSKQTSKHSATREKSSSTQKTLKKTPSTQASTAAPSASVPEPETINVPAAPIAEPKQISSSVGAGQTADVKKLLTNIRFANYRISDLLTDVHPDRWKLNPTELSSFNQLIETLRTQMTALEDWRGRFEKRPDSIYLGFETYATINQVLPRLSGVAHAVTQNDNANYGLQFSEAGDHLFDLQQTLATYIESLMGSQDQVIVTLDNNLAHCQNTLTYAMQSTLTRPIPMRNAAPQRPESRRVQRSEKERSQKASRSEHPQEPPKKESASAKPAAPKKS